MILLQSSRFLFQAAFLCEKDLVMKIYQIMRAIANSENLRQYKGGFYLILEQILAFAWNPNIVRELKICIQISNDILHY